MMCFELPSLPFDRPRTADSISRANRRHYGNQHTQQQQQYSRSGSSSLKKRIRPASASSVLMKRGSPRLDIKVTSRVNESPFESVTSASTSAQVNSNSEVISSQQQSAVSLVVSEADPLQQSKSRFLVQLERFIQEELRLIGDDSGIGGELKKPNESRLRVFQTAFDYLINGFRTYAPILSLIKHEYDDHIDIQGKSIASYQMMESDMHTAHAGMDATLNSLHNHYKEEIRSLKSLISGLRERIDKLQNCKMDLEVQVGRLSEELGKENELKLEQMHSRKLLVSEVYHLENQCDERDQRLVDMHEAFVKSERCILLQQMEIDALKNKCASSNIITREVHETALAELESLRVEQKKLEKERDQTSQLREELKDMELNRNRLDHELNDLRRCGTPRPDWLQAGDYVEAGRTRWEQKIEDKSSDVIVKMLLQEIDMLKEQRWGYTKLESSEKGFFDGIGCGPVIPRYLRFTGRIRNRQLSKRDTVKLVKDIWKEKEAAERTTKEHEFLHVFIHTYMLKRFVEANLSMEWAYNFHDGLMSYSDDPDINMFVKILTGELDEQVYYEQRKSIDILKTKVRDADVKRKAKKGEPPKQQGVGKVSSLELDQVLALHYPCKSQEDMEELRKSYESDIAIFGMTSEAIDYERLFEDDIENNRSAFLDLLYNQSIRERNIYLNEILLSLESNELRNEITFKQAKRALKDVDSMKLGREIYSYLCCGFGRPPNTPLDNDTTVKVSSFFRRLSHSVVRRSGIRTTPQKSLLRSKSRLGSASNIRSSLERCSSNSMMRSLTNLSNIAIDDSKEEDLNSIDDEDIVSLLSCSIKNQ